MWTSRDVAIEAGVSQATVSRALRGDPRVAPATRERVVKAAAALGYTPNLLARGLVTEKTSTVGVVVADLTNPFYPYLLRSLHDAFNLAGYRLVLFAERTDNRDGREHLSQLLDRSLDGVLIATATLESQTVEFLTDRGMPVVLVVRYVDGLDVDRVIADNVAGGRLAAQYLVDAGHTRIGAIFGPANTSTARDREKGFRQGLEEAGIPFLEDLRRDGNYSHQSGHQWGLDLLTRDDRPTALLGGNDVVTFGVIDAAHRLGLSVPKDVSILGFDDIPMAAWEVFSLSTVRQPFSDMAFAAATMLVDRIEGAGDSIPARNEVYPVSLVKRDTVAAPGAEAPLLLAQGRQALDGGP